MRILEGGATSAVVSSTGPLDSARGRRGAALASPVVARGAATARGGGGGGDEDGDVVARDRAASTAIPANHPTPASSSIMAATVATLLGRCMRPIDPAGSRIGRASKSIPNGNARGSGVDRETGASTNPRF